MPQQITPPVLIDIGSDADAGEWIQALPFASFAVIAKPAHPDPVAARATLAGSQPPAPGHFLNDAGHRHADRDGLAPVSLSLHDNSTSPERPPEHA